MGRPKQTFTTLEAATRDPVNIARELALTRKLAQSMADYAPNDPLSVIGRMQARAKADFTHEIGRNILKSGISPLEFLVREMRDSSNDKVVRIKCAVEALPYLHVKAADLPEADPSAADKFKVVREDELEALSPEEFDQLKRLSEKVRGAV